nr:EAL domain-containing protein [uncultured Sulfurimonas sp.]
MKLKQLIALVLSVGIISSIAIVYFYILQKEFTKQHREFILTASSLENAHINLEQQILQNSIYSYHNQDEISSTIKQIEQTYTKLIDSEILDDKKYIKTKIDLLFLQKDINLNLQNIEEYLMLNAGIKNSLLFFGRHTEEALFLEKENRNLYIKATNILKHYNDAKRTQDVDYIKHNNFLLQSNSNDQKTQEFIKKFNLHSNYLAHKFPIFIQTTKRVLNNDINKYLENVRKDFLETSVNDFKILDMFAFVLFSLFISSLFFIILFFIKYLKENKKLQIITASLEDSLIHDQLCNIHNRRAFELDLQKITQPHLLILNIDDFKYTNDIYGNDVGNAILQELAHILKDEFSNRTSTCVYRLGGDEFGILFNKITNKEALKIAKDLEKKISNHDFIVYSFTLHLAVSIVSNSTVPILENADLALKLLKKDHTKRVLEYSDALNIKTDVKENMKTIKQIKTAIENDKIVPFFQPIVNLKTSKIEKYEALVRLKLEDGTFLPPYKFLTISKKSSLYHFITKTMIEKTLKMAKEFPQYRFSINISMLDIVDKKLVEMLFETLSKNRDAASRLDIELLESENLQDLTVVQDFITRLHLFGSKILIDDFGTGYSNFSYFSDLDIDIIKIDGSIVSEIEKSERKLHMLTSIHKFADGMNMKNVAEFVETKEVAHLLRDIGIEYVQGYYFSPPLERPLDNDEVII